MITTIGKFILNNLSLEVSDSKYFSTLADGAAEHLSVKTRFVDSDKNIREDFVGLKRVSRGQRCMGCNRDDLIKIVE